MVVPVYAPPQTPFSSPVPHHRLAHAMLWLFGVLVVILLISWIAFKYIGNQTPVEQPATIASPSRQDIISAVQPSVNVSSQETAARQALLDQKTKQKVSLTPAEKQARQALLENL